MENILHNIILAIGFIGMVLGGICIVALIIYTTIENILDRKKAKEKYANILTDLYDKLKSKSVEDIVLKEDFIVKNDYYKLIQPGKYITEYIEELASEILNYLNIKNKIDIVVLYDENNRYNSTKEKAGYYRSNTIARDIHIVVKKDYGCRDIVAILCHEICHLYMELIGIEYKDKQQNEEATDVIAILLGFGKIMINGYMEHQYEEDLGYNTRRIHKSKIGYISSRDCSIIYRLVKRIKEYQQEKKQTEIIFNKTKNKTIEKLELLRQLFDSFLVVSQNKPTSSISKEDILKMQELYIKIENGYFSTQIDQINNRLSKELTQEELEEIDKKIDLLCYEITMYNSLFSKH